MVLQVIEGDPRTAPVIDDEDDDTHPTEAAGRAHKLMKEMRRRKGLHTDEQVVVYAEKQRTLNKKK